MKDDQLKANLAAQQGRVEEGWKSLPFEPTEDQLGGMMLTYLERLFPDDRNYSVTQEQLDLMRSIYKAAWRAAKLAQAEQEEKE